MIGDLVKGREKSNVILVEDNIDTDGRPLIACFLLNLAQRVDEVHVVCFDSKSKELSQVVNSENSSRVHFHDGHSDILGWNKSSKLSIHSDLIKYLQNHGDFHGNKKVAIVIDSLSPLLLHRPVPFTCQTINRLSKKDVIGAEVEQLVCFLHADLHDNHSLILVEHISSSITTMQRVTTGSCMFCCNTLHKKASGKIIKSAENFNLTNTFDIVNIKEAKPSVLLSTLDTPEQIDPAANLTFNLSLSEKEKDDRSKVKLPYTYNQDRQKEATLTKSVGESKIFYQPDEADDFDEEDPDDDLDI